MAITVENGLGVIGAESYVTVAEADAYHLNNGNADWAAITDEAAKESALRKACRYLDGKYRPRWKGYKVLPATQALEWPRAYVSFDAIGYGAAHTMYANYLPSDQIPQRLKDAQCELALRALSGDLAADTTQGVKREKIDVLETEYFAGSTPGAQAYPVVDQLLSDYLIPSGSADVLRG